MAAWDSDTRLAYIWTWNAADDEGRLQLNPAVMRAGVFTYHDVTLSRARKILSTFCSSGRILPYRVNGQTYGVIVNWFEHQVINRPQQSKLPTHPTFVPDFVILPTGKRDKSGKELFEKAKSQPGVNYFHTPGSVIDESLLDHGTVRERSVNGHGTGSERSHGGSLLEGKGSRGAGEVEDPETPLPPRGGGIPVEIVPDPPRDPLPVSPETDDPEFADGDLPLEDPDDGFDDSPLDDALPGEEGLQEEDQEEEPAGSVPGEPIPPPKPALKSSRWPKHFPREKAVEAFQYWVKKFGKHPTRSTFLPDRERCIHARACEGMTPKEAALAIFGCWQDGERWPARRENLSAHDFKLIFRNRSNVERFMEMALEKLRESGRDLSDDGMSIVETEV